MPYIGKLPTSGAFHKLDAISTVNGQAAYTMQLDSVNFIPDSPNNMLVTVNGILQSPTTNYNISGSTITFTSALVTGDVINSIIILGSVLNVGTPSDATVTNAKTNFVSTSSAAGLQIKGDGTTDGTLQLNCSQNSHGVKIKSPSHASAQSYTLTLPTTAPSSGKALITDGSGNLSFGGAGGLVFLGSQTASTSSSLDFTSNINSTYNSYLFVIESLRVSSDSSLFYMQTSTDGGSSFDTSGYQYSKILRYSQSTSVTGQNSASDSQIVLAGDSNSNAADTPMNGHVNLYDPSNSATFTYVDYKMTHHDSASNKNLYFTTGNGQRESAADVDAVRFLLSTGTFTSGTIRMYGRVKS